MQLRHKIAPGIRHIRRIPAVKLRLIELYAVVMLGDGHNVFRAALLKHLQPFVRIKASGGKLLDYPAVIPVFSVCLDAVRPAFCAFQIHLPRIPFAFRRRHAVRAPVDKQPEPPLAIPLRDSEGGKAFPGILERSLGDHLIYGF